MGEIIQFADILKQKQKGTDVDKREDIRSVSEKNENESIEDNNPIDIQPEKEQTEQERLATFGWLTKTEGDKIEQIVFASGIKDGTNDLECDSGNHYGDFMFSDNSICFKELDSAGNSVHTCELVHNDYGFDFVEDGEVSDPFIDETAIAKDPKIALKYWGKKGERNEYVVNDEMIKEVKQNIIDNFFIKDYPGIKPEHLAITAFKAHANSAIHNDIVVGTIHASNGSTHFSLDMESGKINISGDIGLVLDDLYQKDFEKNVPETEERKMWEQNMLEQIKNNNPESRLYFAGYGVDGGFWSVVRNDTSDIPLEESLKVYFADNPDTGSVEELKINNAEMLRDGGTTTIETDKGTVHMPFQGRPTIDDKSVKVIE